MKFFADRVDKEAITRAESILKERLPAGDLH